MLALTLLLCSQDATAGAILRNAAMLNLEETSVVETSVQWVPDSNPLLPGQLGGYALETRMRPWQALVLETHIARAFEGSYDLSVGAGVARRGSGNSPDSDFIGHASAGMGVSARSVERIEGSAWYATVGAAFALPVDRPSGGSPAVSLLLSMEGAMDVGVGLGPEPVVIDVGLRSAPIVVRPLSASPIPICRLGARLTVTPMNEDAELSASVVIDFGPLSEAIVR